MTDKIVCPNCRNAYGVSFSHCPHCALTSARERTMALTDRFGEDAEVDLTIDELADGVGAWIVKVEELRGHVEHLTRTVYFGAGALVVLAIAVLLNAVAAIFG
jgi:hypothetical protein